MNSFSAINRNLIIQQLNNASDKEPFDLLVIGGGITGAGIALDATARGLKVVLVEMQDFSAGTSSRSTKLIHGGLRYLKQLEFKLVAEVGKERKIIHQNAPHLAKPELMLLPIVKGGSLNKFSAKIAMRIYEWLANVKKEEKHQILSAQEVGVAEPLLTKENLLGGILFYEYKTNDSRLTIEIIKEAVGRGATALNYMKVVSFIYKNEIISGAKVKNEINGELFEIKAKYIVNAGGPWVDELDDLDKKAIEHKLHITKGVHLVVNQNKLAVKQSVYFDTLDKRMIFVIPHNRKTYIGTTDTFYNGELTNPKITEEDTNYLLKCVNAYFPLSKLTNEDIESGWAGLRPLVNKPGKGPSEISRKDELFISSSGLIIIAGGKLTGYRKMAERVVDLVAKSILKNEGKIVNGCSTDSIKLSGGKISGSLKFSEFLKTKIQEGINLGLSTNETEILIYRYGSEINEIYSLVEKQTKIEKNNLPAIISAQLIYAIEKEMCLTPTDFFIRRTGMLYFDIEAVKKTKSAVLLFMQNVFKWDTELQEKFSSELESAIENTKM